MFPDCTSSALQACGPGRHPTPPCCPELLLLTSDWPHCNRCLGILFLVYGSTRQVQHPPVRPPLSSSLILFTCLPIPLDFRTRLRVSQPEHRVTAGWMSLQQHPVVSCALCAPTPPPPPTPPLHTLVPPLLLRTQLLPWTVCIAHVPLPPLSSWVLPLSALRPPGCCLTPFPVVVPRCCACLMLRTWSVMTRSTFLD
jgi:hypothetical protein